MIIPFPTLISFTWDRMLYKIHLYSSDLVNTTLLCLSHDKGFGPILDFLLSCALRLRNHILHQGCSNGGLWEACIPQAVHFSPQILARCNFPFHAGCNSSQSQGSSSDFCVLRPPSTINMMHGSAEIEGWGRASMQDPYSSEAGCICMRRCWSGKGSIHVRCRPWAHDPPLFQPAGHATSNHRSWTALFCITGSAWFTIFTSNLSCGAIGSEASHSWSSAKWRLQAMWKWKHPWGS